jgi:DNA excision repair protein ERCC-4
VPLIRVDVHERPSGIADRLEALGAEVDVRALQAGDYEVGRGTLVERKQVPDLHLSLAEGRFWAQLGDLRGASRWAYLLVEGPDLEAGPLRGSSIRGACLAVMEQRIRLIRAFDREESALWLYRLAMRCQRRRRKIDRPAYAQVPKAVTSEQAAEGMLAAVPGISTVLARALLARFGSIDAVVAATPEEWQKVRGIGAHRATQLHATVSARWPCGQRAQDPST